MMLPERWGSDFFLLRKRSFFHTREFKNLPPIFKVDRDVLLSAENTAARNATHSAKKARVVALTPIPQNLQPKNKNAL